MFAFANRFRRSLTAIALSALSASAVILPVATAQAREPLIVSRDLGGSVMQRYRELNQLRLSNTRVELRGQCVSACTMYLGLSQACVTPNARLGFHGPFRRGQNKTLAGSSSSQLMAAHYPTPLRKWFLAEGQYITRDRVAWFSGASLISMGVKKC